MICAGRRFGKTFLARAELLMAALSKPHSLIWYVAPTYRQAKELMWKPLKELVPKNYIKSKNETDLSMVLVNDSEIKLKGADNADALRGLGLDFIVYDESAFQGKYVWDVTQPALSDKLGKALWITTPSGYNWFYDLVMENKDKRDQSWGYHHFTTMEGGNVPEEELERAKRDMDPRMFRQEYLADFMSLSGRVYYAFDRDKNSVDLSDSLKLAQDGKTTVYVGQDFNVSPGACVFAIKRDGVVHVIGDLEVHNSNTALMAEEIRRRFPKNPIMVFPDPAGASRKTSAGYGVTDFTILQQAGFQVYPSTSKYSVSDRINTVNTALCNAADERHVLFHNGGTTTRIQKSLDGFTYLENTSIPDPKSPLVHISDALGYMLMILTPIAPSMRRIDVTGA
jgi:hypothetical protein